TGERLVPVGRLKEPGLFDRIHTAQSALAGQVAEGRFRREREANFDFLYHFDSVDACLSFLAEDWPAARIADDVLARARARLPPGSGELLIRERVTAARLRRRAAG